MKVTTSKQTTTGFLAAMLTGLLIGGTLTYADEPVAGWGLVRWGMTVSEIQSAYPATKTLPKGKKYKFEVGGREYYAGLALVEAVRVEGYDFEVQFIMDDSDRLAAVYLHRRFDKNVTGGKIAYDTVKDLLIQKYGKPTAEHRPDDKVIQTFQSAWHSPRTRIECNYFSTPLTGACGITIRYEKPRDVDKL